MNWSASATSKGLITTDPAQGLEIGADDQSPRSANTKHRFPFSGVIDEVRLYFQAADEAQIAKRFEDGSEISSEAVLAVSFDDGTARDHSTYRNDGTLEGGKLVEGKFGKAIQFSAREKRRRQQHNETG